MEPVDQVEPSPLLPPGPCVLDAPLGDPAVGLVREQRVGWFEALSRMSSSQRELTCGAHQPFASIANYQAGIPIPL
jgi:hypothetical protein